MKKLLLILTLFITVSIPSLAQQPTLKDSLLDHMTGSWLLKGTIAGRQITHDIEAGWVLAHQYMLIRETSHEKTAEGKPQYEANVYIGWDQASGEYVCIWLDVYGGITPESIGRTKPAGNNEIPFIFRDSSNTDNFHTTFIYNKDTDTWQWLMANVDKGKLLPFADIKLTKKQ
jgi:hypothetical protein